jgi:protease-4
MKRFLIWMAVILGAFFVFIFLAYLFISSLFDTEPMVGSNSYVLMRLGGGIQEYQPPDAMEEYLRGTVIDLKKVRQSLKMAAVDDRIKRIILDVGFVQTGFAKLHEMQQLIGEYRESGKKIIACLEYGLTRDYYLATACDSIFIQPGGTLFLTGLLAEVTFYKGMFDKIGVEADFEHVGKYKNAPEVYTHQTMSDAQREVIDEILDVRYADIIKTIAQTRNISEMRVRDLMENVSGFSAEEALARGLIDGVKYLDEVEILESQGEKKLSKIFSVEYSRLSPSSLGLEKGPAIAVIYCSGTIAGGEDTSGPYFGDIVGANRVTRNIRLAAKSKSIKAIILRINSPGGSGIASDQIWHAVAQAKKAKPVVASISDVGASGGYLISLPADSIVAQKLSLIGSIGVFAGKFNINKLYSKLGLNTVSLQRGKNASLFSLNSKFSDSERKVVRKMIEDTYKDFIQKVADSRNLTVDQIYPLAQGRVWNGEMGKELGLIDIIGGLDEAIEIAKELAEIDKSENVRLLYYPKRKSFLTQLLRTISVSTEVLRNPLRQLRNHLQELHSVPLMIIPFSLEYY